MRCRALLLTASMDGPQVDAHAATCSAVRCGKLAVPSSVTQSGDGFEDRPVRPSAEGEEVAEGREILGHAAAPPGS